MSKCSEKSIQEAAYYLWQNNGCPAGNDEYFWAKAVEQLSNCNCSKSSKSSSTSTAKKASASTSKTATKKTTASKK